MYVAKISCPNNITIYSSIIKNSSIQPESKQPRYNIKLAHHTKLTAVAKVASVYLLDKTVAIVICLALNRACHDLAAFTQTELQICFAAKSLIVSNTTIRNTGEKMEDEDKNSFLQ